MHSSVFARSGESVASIARGANLRVWGAVCALLVALGGVACAHAAEAGDVDRKRSDLEEVNRRLRSLQKEIADTEESRSSAVEALANAERAVSRVQRELQAAGDARAEAERALARLEAEQKAVEMRIAGRQDELAEWMRRQYIHGAGGVAPLLSARDPNQISRDAYYLEHLGKARLELIETLRTDLREKAQLGEQIAARRDRLAALEAEQRARRSELESVQVKRREAVAGLAEQLRSQRKEAKTLRQDQERLGRLVAVLAKRAAERVAAAARAEREQLAREQAAARDQAARERAARTSEGRVTAAPAGDGRPRAETPKVAEPTRAEPVVGQARQVASALPTGVSFTELRGRMRFPVRGELVGRFGAPRAEGGTTWRGVFIRAQGGTAVHAVAAGEVVFSDWLRGYGNLIIVDHGGDYLTIYGNNDALLREAGARIGAGDTIASVGASRGDGESGLYFEIRHRGQPLDPLKWVQVN